MHAALRMKVEEIQRVIFGLLAVDRGDRCGADLEFQCQDCVRRQQDDIDAPSQTKQRIFKQHAPRAWAIPQCCPQQDDLLTPRMKLRVTIQVVRLDETHGEALNDCLRFARQQLGCIAGPPGIRHAIPAPNGELQHLRR